MAENEVEFNRELLLRLIRERFGTQVAFARAIGVSKQVLGYITTGQRDPSLTQAYVIANRLGLKIDDMLVTPPAVAGQQS